MEKKASDMHCVRSWRKVIWCSWVMYFTLAYTKYCSLNKGSEHEVKCIYWKKAGNWSFWPCKCSQGKRGYTR